MARRQTEQDEALARARKRRARLDADRDVRDREIEEATARVMVSLGAREAAETVLGECQERCAEAIRALLALKVTIERAAALVEIPVGEVRRLAQPAGEPATAVATVKAPDISGPGLSPAPAAGEGDRAVRRAG